MSPPQIHCWPSPLGSRFFPRRPTTSTLRRLNRSLWTLASGIAWQQAADASHPPVRAPPLSPQPRLAGPNVTCSNGRASGRTTLLMMMRRVFCAAAASQSAGGRAHNGPGSTHTHERLNNYLKPLALFVRFLRRTSQVNCVAHKSVFSIRWFVLWRPGESTTPEWAKEKRKRKKVLCD